MSNRKRGLGAIRALSVSSVSESQNDEQSRLEALTKAKMEKLGFAPKQGISDKATAAPTGRIHSVSSATDAEVKEEKPAEQTEVKDTQTADAVLLKELLAKVDALQTQAKTEVDASKAEAEKAKADLEAAQKEAADLQAKIAARDEEAANTAKELQQVKEMLTKLEGAWKPRGEAQSAQQLTVLGEGSQEMRNWERMIETASKTLVTSPSGAQYLQADLRSASSYWRKNKESIRDGVEALMRGKGFFGGQRDNQAITLVSDIPSIAYNYLSTFVRESHQIDMIHWQFCNYSVAPGTPPRLNTAVPRYPYRARPTAAADRELTPGTDISSSTDNVSELIALITIKELGLGKDQNNAPIGVAEFVSAFSMTNLESIIDRNLGFDYQAYKDMLIYSQWFTTDRIVYNNAGNVTTSATDVVTGSQGTITREFLISLRSYMKTLQIPTYRDGYYGLVLNPTAIAQYMADLTSQERFVSPEQGDMVTRTLQQATGQEFGGVVSGYRGTHDGFHIFEQNVYGIGSPGDTGTQTVSFGTGVGSRVCDTNFAFGADTVAWATALPVEIRPDDRTDFSRRQRFIWYSHEGVGELDVKFNAGTGTQLRVVGVRSLRTPA